MEWPGDSMQGRGREWTGDSMQGRGREWPGDSMQGGGGGRNGLGSQHSTIMSVGFRSS